MENRYKFKILIGMHFSAGKRYDARDPKANIIDTDIDLIAKFGESKFELLVDSESGTAKGAKKVLRAEELDKGDDKPVVEEPEIEEPEIIDELKSEDEEPEEDDSEGVGANHLVAVHRGGGSYIVVDARTDEPIHEGYMSREEAEALAED